MKIIGPLFAVPSRVIEGVAVAVFVIIFVIGIWLLWQMPAKDFVRAEILRVVEVIAAGLGVVALLLLWAQLRHTAVLNKLLSYHEYFHDLPNAEKVRDLYKTLSSLKIAVPLWQSPLTKDEVKRLVEATEEEGGNAALSVREYLNDFEEFCAAINCGLVDEDYAYEIEVTRALNAYFGFRELIIHWLAEDRRKADLAGEVGPSDVTYYRELRSVAERWKERKQNEGNKANKRRRGRIKGKL